MVNDSIIPEVSMSKLAKCTNSGFRRCKMKKGFSIFIIVGITIITLPIILSQHPEHRPNVTANILEIESSTTDKYIQKRFKINPRRLVEKDYNEIEFVIECLGVDNIEVLDGMLDNQDTDMNEIETFLRLHLYDDQLSLLGIE